MERITFEMQKAIDSEVITECEKSAILEMLEHFALPLRRKQDEERYIYSERILNKFLFLNKNPDVVVEKNILDGTNHSFYTLYRVRKNKI